MEHGHEAELLNTRENKVQNNFWKRFYLKKKPDRSLFWKWSSKSWSFKTILSKTGWWWLLLSSNKWPCKYWSNFITLSGGNFPLTSRLDLTLSQFFMISLFLTEFQLILANRNGTLVITLRLNANTDYVLAVRNQALVIEVKSLLCSAHADVIQAILVIIITNALLKLKKPFSEFIIENASINRWSVHKNTIKNTIHHRYKLRLN